MPIFEIRADDSLLVEIEQTEDGAKARALEIEALGKRCKISRMDIVQTLNTPALAPNEVIRWDRDLMAWVSSDV